MLNLKNIILKAYNKPNVHKSLFLRNFSNINIKFIQNNNEILVSGKENETVINIIKKYNIDIECACDGQLMCSTCHVIVDNNSIKKLDDPCDDEDDMLDLVPELHENSRLGCIIKLKPELDNMILNIPSLTSNHYNE